MNGADLLCVCRELYDQHGFKALTFRALQAQGQLYMTLYHRGLKHSVLIEKLGLKDACRDYQKTRTKTYAGKIREPWTWKRVVREAKAAMERHGQLSPSLWFQKNGLGALVHFVYRSGKTWADLREAVGDFTNSKFVASRNGLRWLSHAEASLSNFLYARGVDHKKGERYPDAIADFSDAKHAFYDIHMKDKDGEWVDIEVWGDNPLGHDPMKYARRRKAKEKFNQSNPRFVGIHHESCYDDGELSRILEPFIDLIQPFQFDKPTDRLIPSTHWSNADELIEYCRKLASEIPDGIFPTEEWLRKRGKWADRPGPVYNTLAVYIRIWLGGVRKLRQLLGQQHASTIQWNGESALREYKRFFEEYGKTPGQVLGMVNDGTADESISEEVAADASRIVTALSKYVGSVLEAQRRLGMKPSRRYGMLNRRVRLGWISKPSMALLRRRRSITGTGKPPKRFLRKNRDSLQVSRTHSKSTAAPSRPYHRIRAAVGTQNQLLLHTESSSKRTVSHPSKRSITGIVKHPKPFQRLNPAAHAP